MGRGAGTHATSFVEGVERQNTEGCTQPLCVPRAAPWPQLPAAPPHWPLPQATGRTGGASGCEGPFPLGLTCLRLPWPLSDLTTLARSVCSARFQAHFAREVRVLYFLCTKIHCSGELERVPYTQHLFTSWDAHTSKNKHTFIFSLIFGATYT